jgi:hypothetical protein
MKPETTRGRLKMSNDFYAQRKKMQAGARQAEQQYSQAAMSNAQNVALAAPKSIASEFRSARNQVQQGRMYGDRVVPNLQQGQYGEAAKNFLTGAALETAGGMNTVLSPVTGLFNSIIPNLGVTERIMNTNLGQRALQLAQQNPRAAAVLGAGADMGLARTGGGAFTQSLGAVADNTPTKVPGFYDSPNPLNKLKSTVSAAAPNVPTAIRQGFTPEGQAYRRAIGTGRARGREYSDTGGSRTTAGEQRGNAMASAFIETQRRGETSAPLDTVVGNTVEVQRYAQDWTDLSNIERVKEGLRSYTDDIPDVVVDVFANHLTKVHGVSNNPGRTSLVIRRPETGESLQGEATGVAKATSPAGISSLASSRIMASARAALPDAEPVEFYKQFVSVAKHAHADKLRLAVREGELPDEPRSVLLNRYWRLKIREQKGHKINEKQQQVLDYFDGAPKATLNDKGNGIYAFQENHASAAQDLGGVNDVVAIDTNNNMIYTMVSDGHDMFGMDPPGGNSLLNATPIYSFKAGTKAPEKKGAARPEESVARIEEITGMPKQKGESNVQYQARVMRDYEGEANLQDYINVGKNVGRFGMLTGGMLGEDEEQQ